ncbi:hypothetical protein EDD21DRAFT_419832 [Dissophora ornata]|nr:hypothetical protein EDD21DRAFT_419832 [Dissophora ornata]
MSSQGVVESSIMLHQLAHVAKTVIERKIHNLDCITLNGGYTQSLGGTFPSSEQLKSANSSYPARKRKGTDLVGEKSWYDAIIGSLKSKFKGYFAETRTALAKFSHTAQPLWSQPQAGPKLTIHAGSSRLQNDFLSLATTASDGDLEMDNGEVLAYAIDRTMGHRQDYGS